MDSEELMGCFEDEAAEEEVLVAMGDMVEGQCGWWGEEGEQSVFRKSKRREPSRLTRLPFPPLSPASSGNQ